MKNKSLKTPVIAAGILGLSFLGGYAGNQLSQNQHLLNNQTQVVPQKTQKHETSTTLAVNKVQNAVVSVINYAETDQSSSIFNLSPNDNGEDTAAGEGSGVIYKKDGKYAYLVTNTHVISGSSRLDIQFADGSKVEGEVVGSDVYSDISVVRIPADKVQEVAIFGDSSQLSIGETAIAIGSPLGTDYANSVTQGIISSLERTVTSRSEDGQTISTKALQTDAAINPGNSGGPLINIDGQVIGITSSKIASSISGVSVEGMGFAIPSNEVIAIVEQLEQNGSISRPALGISMLNLANLSTSDWNQLKLPEEVQGGVVVRSIQAGFPVDGKLKQYDVITKIDDTDIESTSDLQSALYSKNINDTISIEYYRDGKLEKVDVKLNKSTKDLNP
ncbi:MULTISPECIES: S1C family serine protease [unclassified Streptococcus]|uniref:S1C family serine protease n=1 Tax=unclassified Streptococcus TaxID=2608887 RepID=UPI00107196AD|nr:MULTISPECIES: S1C family serine protease [unclassified Streptococcus]MBF0805823.1 serine protease [Streptococcus sp. 19428wA2_WM07]TFU28621.1 serine protease [Streptococcus sp. WM07]